MRTFIIILSLLITPAWADGLPELGDVSQDIISPQMEYQIGMQNMLQIRADKSYLDDPDINDYLTRIGARLVVHSSEPAQPFEFFALNDSTINAFAMPGGFVGVHTGLIMLARSESELASVLSHEISHVTQHHIARLIASQRYDALAMMAAAAAAIFAARSGNTDVANAAIIGAQAGALQRQLGFTREHEREADRLGLTILEKAGFDTRAMPTFFERMQKATHLAESGAPSYLRTHPVTVERIADIANRIEKIPYRMIPDSLDFQLVRARIIANQNTPKEAVIYFESALGEKSFGNPTVQRYGLILALMRDKKIPQATHNLEILLKDAPKNAMIAGLAGELMQKEGRNRTQIVNYYQEALNAFPYQHSLIYNYADLLLQDKQYKKALDFLEEKIHQENDNPKLYTLQARAYAALNRMQESHHMLAYTNILNGNLEGAVEQLELAKRAGDDYYQLSIIDSELRQFRAILDARARNNR